MSLSLSMQLMVVALAGFLCQWGAWRAKIPAILPLLLCGIALGVFGVINTKDISGDILMPWVSIAVAIVLFEGSLTLKFSELKGLAKPVQNLVTIGAGITWAIMTATAYWVIDGLSFELALLFGALVTVTGPTVIVPLLRSVRPVASVSRILRWEGIVIDPIGALLAVLAYELVLARSSQEALPSAILLFAYTTGVGAVAGYAAARAMGAVLRRHWVPEYLRSYLVLAFVIGQYVLVNEVVQESGLMAVTVCGITLANLRGINTSDILSFKENLTVLLISALFIVLASQLDINQLIALGGPALIILLVAQFIARPLSVLASTHGSSLNWREKALLSWIAPRGIIAASVSALFAERLAGEHIQGGELMVPLTFMIIIGTVLLQSLTSRPIARLLKVAEPAPVGFLIIGANPIARAIAEVLHKNDYSLTLIDNNWGHIKEARMMGLKTFYGHPVSSYADRELNLVGIGRMMGLSQYHELNTVAAMRYRMEFGEQHIYTLTETIGTDDKYTANDDYMGKFLFHNDLTFELLEQLMNDGARVRQTKLSTEFSFEDYIKQKHRGVVPLFAIAPNNRLYIFSSDNKIQPQAGWSIIGLLKDDPSKIEEKIKLKSQQSNEDSSAKAKEA